MQLDLHSGEIGNDYKKHLVIHEFGHALGLCHEHQRSDFWKLINPFIDKSEMKSKLGISDAGFAKDWDRDHTFSSQGATDYDPDSVMHYW